MSTTELAKVYSPQEVEKPIYQAWLNARAFSPVADPDAASFCIVIPPPNVTAALHLGHALNNTLQDILVRYRRMTQCKTLWMPGTDHAGIATQTVVEKRILAEEGKRRTDFQRDQFVTRVQAWKDEYEARIIDQLKAMGCSCDWDRTRFTMDEVCATAVRETFFRLFADGLIYRGKRLVNWDPATQTVLADDEVEHEEVDGHFWYLQYPLAEPVTAAGERITHVTVATTRPETMLGDTAVAINPRDPRADALAGKQVRLPLVGRRIPIVADEHVVLPDPESDDEKARFSTGFLKVTPAHDPDDWQIGLRHDLPVINVMAPDGTISDQHGWPDATGTDAEDMLGLDRFEARKAIVEQFRSQGLLEKVRDYRHSIGHSYRSHVPIEPYLSDQWYVAVKKQIPHLPDEGVIEGTDVPVHSLAGLALKPLLDGRLRFTPDRYAKTYQTWLENLRDWPISRQLWWGHRIPVWSAELELPHSADREATDAEPSPAAMAALDAAAGGSWADRLSGAGKYHLTVEDHPEREGVIRAYVCPAPGADEIGQRVEACGFTRDPDVLDTWFSSALWPFSTLGWPSETAELKTFYPGNVLCTAREIITLWVSRMVMMGQYCLGDIPFSDVFIHAMIQDGEGRKMSKSLGNGIDPFVVVDSHGADAMRFTLASMTTQTQDVRMPIQPMQLPDGRTVNTSDKFDIGRNFCNKLWNASRFTLMRIEGAPAWSDIRPHEHLADRWILSRLNQTARDVTGALDAFRYNELADKLYHFVWDDFCDWYLEIAKARIADGEQTPKAILAHGLDMILRMLHPIIPFVTEAIWQKLAHAAPQRGPGDQPAEPLLVQAHWPRAEASAIDPPAEEKFALLQEVIRGVRNVRMQHEVPPKQAVQVIIQAGGTEAEVLSENTALIASQAGADTVEVHTDTVDPPADAAAVAVRGVKVYVPGIVDVEAERARLNKQRETLVKGIQGIEGKLGNEKFVTRAPAEVVQRERERLASLQADLSAIDASLSALPS